MQNDLMRIIEKNWTTFTIILLVSSQVGGWFFFCNIKSKKKRKRRMKISHQRHKEYNINYFYPHERLIYHQTCRHMWNTHCEIFIHFPYSILCCGIYVLLKRLIHFFFFCFSCKKNWTRRKQTIFVWSIYCLRYKFFIKEFRSIWKSNWMLYFFFAIPFRREMTYI